VAGAHRAVAAGGATAAGDARIAGAHRHAPGRVRGLSNPLGQVRPAAAVARGGRAVAGRTGRAYPAGAYPGVPDQFAPTIGGAQHVQHPGDLARWFRDRYDPFAPPGHAELGLSLAHLSDPMVQRRRTGGTARQTHPPPALLRAGWHTRGVGSGNSLMRGMDFSEKTQTTEGDSSDFRLPTSYFRLLLYSRLSAASRLRDGVSPAWRNSHNHSITIGG
jgi:hypothetical protein